MSTDLFQAVVVSIVVVGNRIVVVLRLVRIYGDVVLPVTLLELLNILADLHKSAVHSPQLHAIQPFDLAPNSFIDMGGRPTTPLLDRLVDDDWMQFVNTLPDDAAFVQQYITRCELQAQSGNNVPAVDSGECETLQGLFEIEFTEAFAQELLAVSRNGRVLFGAGFASPVIPWPGDHASRRGPLAPTVTERTVCVARPDERPDLFDVPQRLNGAFFLDAARRFAPIAARNQLFEWFSSASLDDFAAADRSTLYSIAAAIGVFRVDVEFEFFEDEGAFSEPEARLKRLIDQELKGTRAFYLQHATTTALAFSIWKSLGDNGVPRNSPANIDPRRTVARFDRGTMRADNVLAVKLGEHFELRLFHFDRRGKFLPVPDSSKTHVQLELPDGSVIDTRQDWITNGEEDEEAELSQSSADNNGADIDLSGSGSFEPIEEEAEEAEEEEEEEAAQEIDIPSASPPPLASSILTFTPAQFVHFSDVAIRFESAGAYTLRYFVEDEPSFEQRIAVNDD